jgi:selT/selW/selH-like putative selenoprotein
VAELEQAFPGVQTKLLPSSGGVFLVTVDGEPVFSKKECGGRHAEPGEVVARIRARRG